MPLACGQMATCDTGVIWVWLDVGLGLCMGAIMREAAERGMSGGGGGGGGVHGETVLAAPPPADTSRPLTAPGIPTISSGD